MAFFYEQDPLSHECEFGEACECYDQGWKYGYAHDTDAARRMFTLEHEVSILDPEHELLPHVGEWYAGYCAGWDARIAELDAAVLPCSDCGVPQAEHVEGEGCLDMWSEAA